MIVIEVGSLGTVFGVEIRFMRLELFKSDIVEHMVEHELYLTSVSYSI